MEKAEVSDIEEWLSECRTPQTRASYSSSISTFQEWLGKPLSEFIKLEPKEMRHQAIKFQNEAVAGWKPTDRHASLGNMKPNTIIGVLTALGSFCAFNDKPLRLRGKRLRTMIDLDSHTFTTGDLSKMFSVADVQEKAVLATFCSLGWEASSVIALERTPIQNLILRAQEEHKEFAYFIDQRKKTGVIRLGVLNPLAIEWDNEWLKEPAQEGTRLFSYTTDQGLNKMLRRLARTAHVRTTGRIHTHLIRKWVMSGLSRAGFNEFQIKFVVGKAIPVSDFTYLQTLQREVEERYPKAYAEHLDISGKKQAQQISDEDIEVIRKFMQQYNKGKIKIE